MNKLQRIILTAGMVVFLLMGLIPPWTYTWKLGDTNRYYHFIFNPPNPSRERLWGMFTEEAKANIDVGTLLFQWFLVITFTGVLYWLFRDRQQRNEANLSR